MRGVLAVAAIAALLTTSGRAYSQQFQCSYIRDGRSPDLGKWRIEGKNDTSKDLVCTVNCDVDFPGAKCTNVPLNKTDTTWTLMCDG